MEEEQPVTIRIYPGELRPVYYTSVLAFHSTETLEVIRLALERLQIFEDKTLYELYEGQAHKTKEDWTKLGSGDCPVAMQEKWMKTESREQEWRFFLRRKEHASLVLAEIVSQYISPEVNEGRVEDMCELEVFSEQDMLSNLRARFSNKDIYTYVGSILISINPYYFYSIYNPKYGAMYQGKELGALPPHIFAIADSAYHTMLAERENQCVIISGESGAGKTEATKFLLHHFMSLSAKLDESQSLELITLGTGPVLEAFGNACTVANDNSSRFGKFIMVQFKENGAYHSASIEKYLLEKSRIVCQAPNERNYHVFYYLLVGADPELKKKLQLLNIDEYNYLTQGRSHIPENGMEEYHRLRQSLAMLGFGLELQMGMFTVLSAILQLGNVTLEKKEHEEIEIAQVRNMEAVEVIASLLQVNVETLRSALTTRRSRAGGTDSFVTPYTVEQAKAARDSMAKALYGSLFEWIVNKVNITLSSEGSKVPHKGNSIGVLDIFGFEVFQKNSFEQFCINYANEQLQQYFNKHIFKLEQAEYMTEGIEWSSVSFVDNQECLDLIAKKPTGLLPLLDEECNFPGADDNSLFQKFERQHKGTPCYYSSQLKLQDPQFTITHYASDVTYNIRGFREKNRDLMRQDIVDVLKTSRMDLVRALIGQPPYAVRCWRMAHLKLMAAFAFRKAGQEHKNNHSRAFAFRSGSLGLVVPHKSHTATGPLYKMSGSDGMNSVDAFSIEHGLLHTHVGIRPSRSFETLHTLGAGEEDQGDDHVDMFTASLGPSSLSQPAHLPYGASPRSSRKVVSNGKKKSTPPSTTTSTSLPPLQVPRSNTLPSSPQSPQKDFSKKQEASPTKKAKAAAKKAVKSPPVSPVKKEEGRSRLASISRMQEKLRRRLSRTIKSKEAPEIRERPSAKYWSSGPRMKCSESFTDSLPMLMRSSSMRHGPPKTVSAQFQTSLISLVERLEQTNPFFVRCIKSNGEKAPCKFDTELVLRQLRYTGMMETIKIRKAGFPVRMEFEAFYEKYQFLMGPRSEDLPGQIRQFLHDCGFSTDAIQIGHTKVFMREKQKQALQTELGEKVLARIIKIQRWVRAKMFRCRFLNLRRNAIILQCAVRCWVARKRVDALRQRVCSAVLIQSAWRSYVARKQLVLLKQAAIILQAHWRGRAARLAYRTLLEEEEERRRREEEERQRQEEEKRRRQEEEERQRREEERRRQEEEERIKREEEQRRVAEAKRLAEKEKRLKEEQAEQKVLTEDMKMSLTLQEEEAERLKQEKEERELVEELSKLADEQLQLLEIQEDDEIQPEEQAKPAQLGHVSAQSNHSSSTPIDVRDTLFHFDSMISALEADNLTPSPRPPTSSSPVPTITTTPTNDPTHPSSYVPLAVSTPGHTTPDPQPSSSSNSMDPQIPSTMVPQSTTTIEPSAEEPNISKLLRSTSPTTTKDNENNNIMNNGLPDTPPERKTTPTQEELLAVRNAANVRALKEQFLRPTTPPSPRLNHTPRDSPPHKGQQQEKVKRIIAHMTSLDESDLTPPPSPLGNEIANIRNSSNITDKISHLTQTPDASSAERPRSYVPPQVRRRVVSPFLDRGKGDGDFSPGSSEAEAEPEGRRSREGVAGGSEVGTRDGVKNQLRKESVEDAKQERTLDEGVVQKAVEQKTTPLEEAPIIPPRPAPVGAKDFKTTPEKLNQKNVESPEKVDDNKNRSPPPSSEPPPPLPVRDKFPTRMKKEGDLTVLHSPRRSKHSAQKRKKDTTPPLPTTPPQQVTPPHRRQVTPPEPPRVIELEHEPRSLGRSHSHREMGRRPPMNTRMLGRMGMSQDDQQGPLQPWELDSQSLGKQELARSESGGRREEDEESPFGLALPRIVDEGGNDDDHLVSIILPFRPKKKKEEPKAPDLPKRNRAPPLSKRLSKPLSLDDVFLSFESPNSSGLSSSTTLETPTKEDAWGTSLSGGGLEHSQSATHVELNISTNENGLLFPPTMTSASSDHPLMEAHHYDHLPKKSEYDHLPPLGQEFAPVSRPRSTSDVSGTRLRPWNKKEEFAASEVVPREYKSSEHRYNSIQKRKRSAVSLADMDVLKTQDGGDSKGPIEDSSEFTRCLTPEEIVNLNQRRGVTSPSERMRLFSFTRRHLKLPFSKHKHKKDKDLRDRLVSPDKEAFLGAVSSPGSSPSGQIPAKHHHHHRKGSPTTSKGGQIQDGPKRNPKYPIALAHNFKLTTASKFGVYTCATCNKGFTGFMKQAYKCVDCNIMVHRHCEERAPACKAHIESGSYVTMSRRKIIHKPEDLDNLGRFLLEKIAVLAKDTSHGSLVDKVFKQSLKEFHTFLISTYSLSLQSSLEEKSPKPEEPKISLTFSQLVCNFDNIFRGIAKREGLSDSCHISIGINQIKTFLDEFGKARRTRAYSKNINPHALRRKTLSGRDIQPKVHKGHKFFPQQFKVQTVCEHCSKAIPLLESGEVCEVCGCAYHATCYKKVHKKCEGKARPKDIPEYQSPDKKVASNQFGVPLQNLVPPNTVKVPALLETCFHHLEANGLYTQGLYRKSAGISSKKAVREILEEDPETSNLESFSIHAVAASVKAFFQELPEPLLTWDMYVEFLRAMDLTNKKERQETLHKLISRLPEINHAVFERLIFHLARVAQHEHINKMNPCNLAIIFAPCLLRGKPSKKVENPTDLFKDIQKQTSCLEAIITEQVEKLTATIRGIRTLTSFARETETKLSELSTLSEVSESASSTPSSTLQKGGKLTGKEVKASKRGLTAEERKRLTSTLEEIERERVELTVNLPKLEPFTGEDETGPPLGDSDRWTPSPSPSSSPSPLVVSTTASRSTLRTFSPISENPSTWGTGGRRSEGDNSSRGQSSSSPLSLGVPRSPSTPTSPTESGSFPLLPTGPILPSLTKHRVSHRPHVRPPTSKNPQAKAATPTQDGLANSSSSPCSDEPARHPHGPLVVRGAESPQSPLVGGSEDSGDEMFLETTV